MRRSRILSEDVDRVLAAVSDMDRFEGRSVLITGCAGFLGRTLCETFATAMGRGLRLRSIELLDNFRLGEPEWLGRLAAQDDRIKVRRFDIAKDRLDDATRPEFVLHMASIASPVHYRRFPLETIDANVWGLRRLLDHMDPETLEGFLFFSSSEVYGDPDPAAIPTPESYRGNVASIGPRACYDEAKRFGETLCHVFATAQGLPITIVRPFNNYGPGMRLEDRRAPADFARSVVHKKDIVLHSDGRPTRTFCYVSDAVAGFLQATTYGRFEVFNIGSDGPEISIRGLAETFCKAGRRVIDYQGSVRHEASDEADYLVHNPNRRCPDLTKARRLLGYRPMIDVDSGVERYLRHVVEEMKAVTV